MRSRRQATLTVSRRSSTHLTGPELEEDTRDFVDVSFREDAADTVEEERPRWSREGAFSEPALIGQDDPADELRMVPIRKPEGSPRPKTPCFRTVDDLTGEVPMFVGTPASRLPPERRRVIRSLPESDLGFSFFLFFFMAVGCLCFFVCCIGCVGSFSMGFPFAQLVNRATERMERIARRVMEPVVVLGSARRGGSCLSSATGLDMVETRKASLRNSESWRGDSDAEADRTCAGRSAVSEEAPRTRRESRELKRARDANISEGASADG